MGQYYKILNITKKEMFFPSELNDGAKLIEFGSGGDSTAALCLLLANSNDRGGGDFSVPYEDLKLRDKNWELTEAGETAKAQIATIAGRWGGDKIVIQGDYAFKGDPGFVSEKRLNGFTNISELIKLVLAINK